MSSLKMRWIAGLVLLCLALPALAAEKPNTIRFKPGEMGLLPFIEMVSDRLDIQIDASGLAPSDFGKIAVPDAGSLNLDRAKALVLTILYMQGYTWIHDATADLYRIVRQRDARDQEIPVIADEASLPDSDLLVTYIMPVEHTPPDYIARAIRSFMPANSRVISDDGIRSIMITDSAHNISKLKKLVERLDTPEVAKEAKAFLIARAKKGETPCSTPITGAPIQQTWVFIALFSLIALVIGFLARGYVIRRIEGGL